MSTPEKTDKPFVPDLRAIYEELSQSVKGWANSLGIQADYYDSRIDEGGSNDWGGQLRKTTEGGLKTAVSLLTARADAIVAEDLRRRFEGLYAQARAYQQRLEALEDERRVHVEGLVSQYRRRIKDDPDDARLWTLCKGPERGWTLWVDGNPLETPEQFAEAIDKTFWEEHGGKLKAQAEMKRAALDLAEHVDVLAAILNEAQAAAGTTGASNKPGLSNGIAPGQPPAAGSAPARKAPAEPPGQAEETLEDEDYGLPQPDPIDTRVVYWLGKRIYLGSDTQIRRLFMLLAKHVGRPHDLGEVQRVVDGLEIHSDFGSTKADIRKAQQRLRTVISKLRRRMEEAELDESFVIIKEGPSDWPSYTMVRRFG